MRAVIPLIRSTHNLMTGRLSLDRHQRGKHILMPNGRCYRVLQIVRLTPHHPDTVPEPVSLWVHVRTRHNTRWLNTMYGGLITPLIAGLPGFRALMWMADPLGGEVEGLLLWTTRHHARQALRGLGMALAAAPTRNQPDAAWRILEEDGPAVPYAFR